MTKRRREKIKIKNLILYNKRIFLIPYSTNTKKLTTIDNLMIGKKDKNISSPSGLKLLYYI
jgi:hypothetical protein